MLWNSRGSCRYLLLSPPELPIRLIAGGNIGLSVSDSVLRVKIGTYLHMVGANRWKDRSIRPTTPGIP